MAVRQSEKFREFLKMYKSAAAKARPACYKIFLQDVLA